MLMGTQDKAPREHHPADDWLSLRIHYALNRPSSPSAKRPRLRAGISRQGSSRVEMPLTSLASPILLVAGFLATNAVEYADTIVNLLNQVASEPEALAAVQARAMRSARRFDDTVWRARKGWQGHHPGEQSLPEGLPFVARMGERGGAARLVKRAVTFQLRLTPSSLMPLKRPTHLPSFPPLSSRARAQEFCKRVCEVIVPFVARNTGAVTSLGAAASAATANKEHE